MTRRQPSSMSERGRVRGVTRGSPPSDAASASGGDDDTDARSPSPTRKRQRRAVKNASLPPSEQPPTATNTSNTANTTNANTNSTNANANANASSNSTTANSSDLWIGAAMYDITGPAAEVGMFGYAKVGQLTAGIHMRLRARAFAFHDAVTKRSCVYVCCDLGMISEWVTQAVVTRLAKHVSPEVVAPGTYTRENVMLSATHTHCAPGGLSHYFIYSMHPPLRGADRQNIECVVHGIVHAIVRAHLNRQPARLRVSKGECLGASVNRSEEAYNANPAHERARYGHNTDKEMTLWRMDGVNGFPIGMINWFAVHPTSMGNWYTLITGDNKGYAAHMFEKEQGTHHLLDRPRAFVAAFAQSNEGDVSPNICGPRHCETQQHEDFQRMLRVANAQLQTARDLYARAASEEPVRSSMIRFAHQYVEYGNIQLTKRWHLYDECPKSTASGCIGVSMVSGTMFDGRGISTVPEGVTWGMYPKVTTMPELQQSQGEKPVIFPTERYGLSPSVLPLQLFVIGDSLSIAGVPFEMTTMAGRRLRTTIRDLLHEVGIGRSEDGHNVPEPVISGLSNAYSGYLTTREEYAVQRYEGASTHFGPNQLRATMQQFESLTRAVAGIGLKETSPTPAPSVPSSLSSDTSPPTINGVGMLDYNVPVVHDGLLPGARYGGTFVDVKSAYRCGDMVTAEFHAAHPKNNLRTQGTFLEVQRWMEDADRPRDGGIWVMHADDGDMRTFFHWRRQGAFASVVTIEWHIPEGTRPGKYRFKVNGDFKRVFQSKVVSYSGYSSVFRVKPSSISIPQQGKGSKMLKGKEEMGEESEEEAEEKPVLTDLARRGIANCGGQDDVAITA